MSIAKRFLVAVFLFMALSASAAAPAACVAGSVASIQGTSCAIGNLVFTFGETHVVDQFDQQSIDTLKFIPLAGREGFAVVGKWTDTFALSELWISGFGVATIDGSTTISGATVNDIANGSHFAELDLVDASNANNTLDVTAGYSPPYGCSNPYSCSGSFSSGPVATAYDPYYALLEGTNPGDGTTTSYATEFFIDETTGGMEPVQAVPEPSACALMLAGVVGLAAASKRRRRG